MDLIRRDKAVVQLSHNKSGNDDSDVVIQHDIVTIQSLPSAFEGMTYKDVVKAVFPNAVVIVNDLNGTVRVVFSDEVWDSPYQKGGK